jgi:predicted fused transcriptional regulator/phosphomethylpyrimidine kinase
MDAVLAEQRAAREESRRYFDKLDAKTDEIIAEGRAGREALLRILDELRGNGGPAPAG